MLLKVRVKTDGMKFGDVTRRVRQLDPDAEILRALKGDEQGDDAMPINKLLAREYGLAHDATENDLAEAILRDRRATSERLADLRERIGETNRTLTQDTARRPNTRSTTVTASDEIMKRATKLAREEKISVGDAMTQVATEDPALYARYCTESDPYSPEGRALAEQRRAAAVANFVRTMHEAPDAPPQINNPDARLTRAIEAVAKERGIRFSEAADIVAKDRPDLVEAVAQARLATMNGPGLRLSPGEEVV